MHRGRLFVGDFRVGGRLPEPDLDGGEPRVLLEGAVMPDAMEVGPDGLLYYPAMGTNDIWRIPPDGGEAERVAGDLGGPTPSSSTPGAGCHPFGSWREMPSYAEFRTWYAEGMQ